MIRRRLVTTPHGVSHQPRDWAQAALCPTAKMEGASSTRLVEVVPFDRTKTQEI